MPWVEFTGTFHWHFPEYGGRVTQRFEPSAPVLVKKDIAEAAIAAGKAKASKRPKGAPDGEAD
ncbi:MAG: hypothetical protein AB7L41_06170 [Flavobacteriaceae bacterium]